MDPVSQLERQWPAFAAGPLARRFPRWHAEQPALQPFAGAYALIGFLGTSRGEPNDRVLHALLTLAARDRLAARACLQAILPALKAQARRRLQRGANYDEVWEALLAFAWEAICTYPLTRTRRVGANLVLQVHHDIARERHPRVAEVDPPADSTGAQALAPARDPAGVEEMIAHAVAEGAISSLDGELVLRTRVDGASFAALAAATGSSRGALRKRRERAERSLRGWLSPQPTLHGSMSQKGARGSLTVVHHPG